MAYSKNTWVARTGTGLNKFTDQNGNTYEFTNTPDSVVTAGTPFTADWLNHIEQGIEDVANGDIAMDNTPTENSNFAVKSGGVYNTLAEIGTIYNNELSSAKSVATGTTFSNVLTLTLPAGCYMIIGQVRFATNATGRREIGIGTGATYVGYAKTSSPAVSGSQTVLNISTCQQFSGSTTLYLNALQNSGSALSVETTNTFFKAIKINDYYA